jgi:aerobic carbon-monoxide dehydrogenase medium subunit
VFPADFAYTRASSLPGALALLEAARTAGDDVKVLAGGQSLLPMMKLRLATAAALLDIGDLAELKGITATGGHLRVGALTTYRDLQRDQRVAAFFPAIADALAVLADPQVRARGTIGGALAHGDPAADLPPVLLALDAQVTIASRAGTRTVALEDFLLGVFRTDLADDELVTAVTIPAVRVNAVPASAVPASAVPASAVPASAVPANSVPAVPRAGQAYEKFAQPASHLPLAGACTAIEVEEGVITVARVGIAGIAPRPFRIGLPQRDLASRLGHAIGAQLPGGASAGAAELDAMLAATIAESLAASGTEPLADQHASGPFRVHLAAVMARRALARALARAVEEGPG